MDCPEDLRLNHDSKWTAEALFNLLDNAVKYTPVSGKIVVTVEQWEMYVKVNVADTGKGISESNQAAIFRRFYREDGVHDKTGVGIGLYAAATFPLPSWAKMLLPSTLHSAARTEKGISVSNTLRLLPVCRKAAIMLFALLVRLFTMVSRMPSILRVGLICRLTLATDPISSFRPLVER